ncbi:calcium/sodium antiporter [Rhodococcus triatomae]|uniref:Cation:H+ antiporter n=1 Tax=Rhodococcus triatomae TaxID=300028 RepID=A0A1G8LCM4_9NOCA|nr:calcium/sodium antiporter [Rhodococcus triatomae]QNG20558.1 calcium/sodium antiporter [Rhodococcus triatomae]QNG23524.1 calcium/sodium antiporter [Rhodococcus triatomae]SDI53197.1 cation:H+ antiporter [Rhodococcus triatomae]
MASVLAVVFGLVALIGGAELLTRGGSRLAAALGISPMIIGLTIVSIGTSTPELAVGIDAALNDHAGLAVGNIVGTNLVNLLLILGASALIRAIALDTQTLRLDLPVMTAAALLLWVMSLDGVLTALEGALLVAAGLVYTVVVVRASRRESAAVREEYALEYRPERRRVALDLGLLLAGLVVIVLGAELLVDGAVDIARALDVSDVVIGLTVVAIGTSAPELVTTLVSTLRGNRDIALGNLLGSSIYNIVFILGVTLMVAPGGVAVPDDVLYIHLPLMAAVALVCVPTFLTGRRISRVEGGMFVVAYCVYLTLLLWAQT